MKKLLKKLYYRLTLGRFSCVMSPILKCVIFCQHQFLLLMCRLQGAKLPDPEQIALVRENVTFLFKSFERQDFAKALYRNIQSYYPGVKVIIADDSSTPLDLEDEPLEVLQLPFNSGVSFGLNRALARVTTPFVIRMDDDELLTPKTDFHHQLQFLLDHPEVDLAAVLCLTAPNFRPLKAMAKKYYAQPMHNAPKPLKIPHMTAIDDHHIVVAKPPQIFVCRTERLRSVGYDDNIRMIDHNEFFFRAAGNLVCVLDPSAFVFHRHNDCDRHYRKYRTDISRDLQYIKSKTALLRQEQGRN